MRRPTLGRKPQVSNAVVRTVVDYGGDPYNEPRLHSIQDEAASRLQGHGSGTYGIANGDPSASFNGYAAPVQTFARVSAPGRNPVVYRDQSQGTIETGLVDGPYADPARRIFAARLAARGSGV